MPNSAVHLALAALCLSAIGLRGRQRAWLSLLAVAPDLDVLTAVPWMLISPYLDLPAGLLVQGSWLLGHRGFSHTLLAAALVGAAVWRWRREAWLTLGAVVAWASHVALDGVTPWPIHPLWPASDVLIQRPLITTLDPLVSLASLVASAAILAPLLVPRLPWPSEARRQRWLDWGDRRADRWLTVSLVAGLLTVAVLPATAVIQGVDVAQVQPAGFPKSQVVTRQGLVWSTSQHTLPWSPAETTETPVFRPAGEDGRPPPGHLSATMSQAWCLAHHLGPYAPLHRTALNLTTEGWGTRVTAFDPVRNATGEGGASVTFLFHRGELVTGYLGGGPGDEGPGFSLPLPASVLEAAPCP